MSAIIEISIPDALLAALGADRESLSHQAVEALTARAYRAGKITHLQVGEILELDRWQTDAFLKGSQAQRPGETGEYASDLAQLRRMEIK